MATRLLATPNDGVLILTLESDDGLPRLERRVLGELRREIEGLAARGFSGCVITGSKTAFAAGAEIGELARLTPDQAHEFSREGQAAFRAIERSSRRVIAAIRGYCFGGGLDLALACHLRIATDDALFAHPGGSLGILTGWGGTQRLARRIGRSRAMEMFVTGRRLGAHEAQECGLISRTAPADELLAIAARFSRAVA